MGSEDAVHIYDSVEAAATLHIEDPQLEPGLVSLSITGIRKPLTESPRL